MKRVAPSKKSASANAPKRVRPVAASSKRARPAASPKRVSPFTENGELRRVMSLDGKTIDWKHVEKLGEQARQAAIRLGVPPPEPWPEMTEEEWARAEESARLVRAIPRRKFKQTSEEMIREMRDAQVGIFPKQRDESADR